MFETISSVMHYSMLFFIVALCLYYYLKYKHTYWERRGVKTIPGAHWFFGHFKDALLLRKSVGILLKELYDKAEENDDFVGFYVLHKPFLLLRNPALIKNILIRDFAQFPDHHFSAESIRDKVGSSNLFNLKSPTWKYLRTKLSPVFTSGKIKNLFLLMVETSESMKDYLENKFSKGSKTQPILIVDTLAKYTTDIISSLAFGLKINSLNDPPPEFFTNSLQGREITVLRGLQFLMMFFFPDKAKYAGSQILGSATDYFRKVFWESMNSREASKTKRGDVIDSLIELKNGEQDKQFKFEGDSLLGQSAIFFVAGRETSITTGTLALCELAKNPELQKRTREEILQKLDQHGFTYEGVMDMKYLFQVVSETLRLYPPAPLIDRVALSDYKIPGTDIVIEKGTPVYVPLRGLQTDPKFHKNPSVFDPDRFSEERKSEIEQCTYMPFGEGPRICIGLRVGLLQTAVALITILKDYEVSMHPDHNIIEDPRLVFISPPRHLLLNFTRLSKVE